MEHSQHIFPFVDADRPAFAAALAAAAAYLCAGGAAVESPLRPASSGAQGKGMMGFGAWSSVDDERVAACVDGPFQATTLFENGRWVDSSSDDGDAAVDKYDTMLAASSEPSPWVAVNDAEHGHPFVRDATAGALHIPLAADIDGANELEFAWRAGIDGELSVIGGLELTEQWRTYVQWLADTSGAASGSSGDAAALAELDAARRRHHSSVRRQRRATARQLRSARTHAELSAAAERSAFGGTAVQAARGAALEAALNARFDAFTDRENPSLWPETPLRTLVCSGV